jgi:5-methyltetrahydropteroyltriglutamate--homocysteine methyltransferase
MFRASAGKTLPTSIIGSLPRPSWYTAVLGAKSFLEAMVNARYREQYEDAVSVHLRAQETAGLDICTDGDAHYDEEVGGKSWQSYPLTHMAGFNTVAEPAIYNVGAVAYPRGHILHDFLEASVFPKIVGPVGPGNLQYAAGEVHSHPPDRDMRRQTGSPSPTGRGCGQLLMYRYFRNSVLIDLLPELFPSGFRERERTQA